MPSFPDVLRQHLGTLQNLLQAWATNLIREERPMWRDDGVDVGRGNIYDVHGTCTKSGDVITLTNVVAAGDSDTVDSLHAAAFTSPKYLVTEADANLTAEVVVGTTPGGELGGTWGTPTVDATHSGSAHSSYVAKSLFDAQTVLAATADDTPAALTLAEQTVVGRLTGGNIAAVSLGIADNNVVQVDQADVADNDIAKWTAAGLEGRSYAELRSDLDLEVGTDFDAAGTAHTEAAAHVTAHEGAGDPHTGYVLESLFDAQTVLSATADNTPAALVVAEQEVVGRLTGGNVDGIALGIADNNVVQIDQADVADNDFAKFTAAGLEGRSYAETVSDLDALTTAAHTAIGNGAPHHAQSHDHSAAGDGQTLQPVNLQFPTVTNKTITVDGEVTPTQGYHALVPYSGGSDNLDWFFGNTGQLYLIRPYSTNVITVRDATVSLGNIYCPSSKSIVLRTQSEIVLIYQVDVGTALVLGGIDPDNETANTIYAGPASGAAAHPAFRAVADADIPATHSGSAHHTRSHTLTSASDHTGTADRVIYVDHAGAVQELALGADGTVLTSTGAATAPAFEAAPGGGVATDPIWDAAGDLAVGSGADTAARLAKGDDGKVLTMVAGAVAWAAATGGGAMATDPLWDAAGDLAVGTGANTGAKLTLTVPGGANLMNVLGVVNGESTPTWKVLFDSTHPEALGTAAEGSGVVAALRNHVHEMPKLDDVAAPDDNTDRNATTSLHGLVPKAVDPASAVQRHVVCIDNGETAYKNADLFDDTHPAAIGTATEGTSLLAAHRDHVHPFAVSLWDADADTGIQVEEAADEDIIRFDIAGAQKGYLGATGLYLANAIAVGPDAVFSAAKYAADIADYALTVTSATILRVTGKFTGTGTSQYFYGLDLNAYYSPVDAGTATLVAGLNFMAWQASERAISSLIGIYGYVKSLLTTTGTIATAAGMYVTKSWLGAKPTTAKGIKIFDMGDAACTTVYGLEIADQTAGTTSLPLAVGPNTGPYLKVVGGAAPGAGLTNVWINESGNVRQVQVVTADGGGHVGAGDLILKVV